LACTHLTRVDTPGETNNWITFNPYYWKTLLPTAGWRGNGSPRRMDVWWPPLVLKGRFF